MFSNEIRPGGGLFGVNNMVDKLREDNIGDPTKEELSVVRSTQHYS